MIDCTPYFDRCLIHPIDEQKKGITAIVNNPFFYLADEMGVGKTLQAVVSLLILYKLGLVNRAIVVVPNGARAVWFSEELGEMVKHLWPDVPVRVTEFRQRVRFWEHGPKPGINAAHLEIIIVNYEFIRAKARLTKLLNIASSKTMLICDEATATKNHRAQQSKAVLQIRRKCGRVLMMSGTPITKNPLDMFSQGQIMDPKILDCKSWTVCRARYAVMRPNSTFPHIIGWQNLEDLQRRFAPFVLRRLKEDVWKQLPPKLAPVAIEVEMDSQTWAIYKEMSDDMVAWLDKATPAVAAQAPVKAMRLAQITSGFLGGIEPELEDDSPGTGARPDYIEEHEPSLLEHIVAERNFTMLPGTRVAEIGREKLDAWLNWIEDRVAEDPNFRLLTWCRFKPELDRMVAAAQARFPSASVGAITGGQRKEDREHALRLINPAFAPQGLIIVVGSPKAGGKAINGTAVRTVMDVSSDYDLEAYLQSRDRVHRPGMDLRYPVSFFRLLAVGPKGQKTIDHAVMKNLEAKIDLSTLTLSAWRQIISVE